MSPAKLSSVLSGVAGEYFVAAELSRLGYIASLTLRNTRGVDILVANADATRSAGIQVKTTQGDKWVLSKKDEKGSEPDQAQNLFYVFVRLDSGGAHAFHVVPRQTIAKHCRETHQNWLTTPGRRGKAHRDNSMRIFSDPDNRYLNRWDLLQLD